MEDYDLSIISEIDLGDGASLALTACPGRRSSYSASLDGIFEWAPTAVLSLIEDCEFPFDPPRFSADLSNKGIAWFRFPIRNYSTPEGDESWLAIAGNIHDILNSKGRVLFHCLGGLGRSGMVAARLLTERGEAAPDAIRRVRRARPGAIETQAQELWVKAGEAGQAKA